MKSKFCSLLAAALVLGSAPHIASAAGGWGLPNLNPFAKKSGPPTSARVSDQSQSGWGLPKMWPSSKTTTTTTGRGPVARKAAGPSTWQKMTTSTKRAWTKTADVLNPFDDASQQQSEPSVTGSNAYFSQVANRKSSPKKKEPSSVIPAWWSGEEASSEPKSVGEFLSQPRPGF